MTLTTTGHRHGYARVSTSGQDHSFQLDALAQAGCARTWIETVSGATIKRPELDAMLEALLPKDDLVVWKLDRLGCSVTHVVGLVNDLAQRGVGFVSLTEGFDTKTPGGRMTLAIFAALAEMEREVLRERTHAGLAVARARGRVGGRPSVVSTDKLIAARALLDAGTSITDTASAIGVSRASLYGALKPSATNGNSDHGPRE